MSFIKAAPINSINSKCVYRACLIGYSGFISYVHTCTDTDLLDKNNFKNAMPRVVVVSFARVIAVKE